MLYAFSFMLVVFLLFFAYGTYEKKVLLKKRTKRYLEEQRIFHESLKR